MYIRDRFKELVEFDFKANWYYFFTIKHNDKVALFDNAHDLVYEIRYIKKIMLTSYINEVVYCFELDKESRLHVHGIATSPMPIKYKFLHRDWGCHHHFSEITKIDCMPKATRVGSCGHLLFPDHRLLLDYITKRPIGPILKSVKSLNVKNKSIIIDTHAYW